MVTAEPSVKDKSQAHNMLIRIVPRYSHHKIIPADRQLQLSPLNRQMSYFRYFELYVTTLIHCFYTERSLSGTFNLNPMLASELHRFCMVICSLHKFEELQV